MLHFIYTKDNGEVSERDTLVISAPNKNYLMLDLSSLSEEDKQGAEILWKEYNAEKDRLFSNTGLAKYIKAFKPECISELENRI